VLAETGWPSAGEPVRDARPSRENAAAYLERFVPWAEANSVPYLYLEAFDEGWKARSEGERGAHFGVALADGRAKPGLAQALRCRGTKRLAPSP